MVAGEGFEPTVLPFHRGEKAAVGSAALTAPRAIIHSRLTLRVIAARRLAGPEKPFGLTRILRFFDRCG